ncbi:MAG: hypothetical protein QOC57_1728 [Ilumatobacteraceae bacterium]
MAELAAARHGVILRSQAVAFGLTPYDIRIAKQRGWLTEPVRGVLVMAGHPATWEQRLAIVTSASTSRPVVSHGAAARLFRLDGFYAAPPEISVLRPARMTPLSAGEVVVHQTATLERADRYRREGLPCTGLARTLSDLGSTESPDRVWQALISARRLHRVNPLWLQQTAHRLHRPGQAGTGVLLAGLRRWGAEGSLPDSWFEEVLRRLLDHPDVPAVQSQYVLTTTSGTFVARLDLAIPAARLGLEGHSREFHFGPIREAADEDRDLRAAAVGWEVLYLGWYAQRRPEEMVRLIAQVCRLRLDLLRSA